MDRIVTQLRILWRAERIVAEIEMRRFAESAGLIAFAALVAVFGLAMLDVAAFFALEPRLGRVEAALVVGLGNLGLAALAVFLSARRGPPRELAVAREVRETAFDALQAEAQELTRDLGGLRRDILGLGRSLGGFARTPFDAALPALVLPLARFLLRQLRKSDKPAGGEG